MKGFTLIELLIVMVIVGALVTIALPKYQTALERGRALEGLRNVQYAAEYINAKHMACESSGGSSCGYDNFSLPETDKIKNKFFENPTITASSTGATVTVSRKQNDWRYKFTATISDDALTSIVCLDKAHAAEEVCTALDLGTGLGNATDGSDNLLKRK